MHEGLDPDSKGGYGRRRVWGAFIEVELVDEFVEGFSVTLGKRSERVSS